MRDDEKTSLSPYPLSPPSGRNPDPRPRELTGPEVLEAIAAIPASWSEWSPLAVAELVDLDREAIPTPGEDRDAWLSFAANCATWLKITFGREEVPNPTGYRRTCLGNFEHQVDAARNTICTALERDRGRQIREQKQTSVAESREAQILAASSPALPPPHPQLDDPQLDPDAWLIGRGLVESVALAELRLVGPDDPDYRDLWRHSETLAKRARTEWTKQLSRGLKPKGLAEVAARARESYLASVRKITAEADRIAAQAIGGEQ